MFEEYMEYKEREKQEALEDKQKEEAAEKMKQVANNIVFLKYIDSIERLIEDKNYAVALDLLMESYNEGSKDEKDLKVLFLLGKTNYLRGRYDLAISFLFKLVKLKFDYPDGFFFLGRSYEALGMKDKADWAYERVK
jgi:TolA-binding protein